jgi:D-sedoheptulose 7-phosphate isomerase
VKAASLAREKGCRVVTLTGFAPTNRLRRIGDLNIYVSSSAYGYVEMAHSVLAHCVTDLAVMRSAVSV